MLSPTSSKSPPVPPVAQSQAVLTAQTRAVLAAHNAASFAKSLIVSLDLYLKRDYSKRLSGKSIYEHTYAETRVASNQVKPNVAWTKLPYIERLPWSLVAQLLVERPLIKECLVPKLDEAHEKILLICRRTLAAYKLTKYMRILGYRKLINVVIFASQTCIRSYPGVGEKRFIKRH